MSNKYDTLPESGMTIPEDATTKAATPPLGPVANKPGADPVREYVSAQPRLFVSRFVQSLPFYIDDLSRDFGADIYDRMLLDPKIYANIHILKAAVLADGYRTTPAIKDQKDQRFPLAKEIAEFCHRNVRSLPRPFDAFLYEMMDGVAIGNKVAEQMHWIATDGKDVGKLVIKNIKVKPRGTTAYVVDAWNNVIGLIGLIPGRGAPVLVGHIVADPANLSNLLPRDKFICFCYNPKDEDPRGRSLLRSVYNPWWIKQQIWGEYVKYMGQFAGQSLWATTPEGALPKVPMDENGNPTGGLVLTPEEVLVAQLQAIQNGSVGAFPFGTAINPIPVAVDGAAVFEAGIAMCNKEITAGILAQTLATEEGEHMARAASDNHVDVMDMGVRHVKRTLSHMVKHDIYRPLVSYNYGEDIARELTPDFDLAPVTQANWSEQAQTVVALYSAGYLDSAQVNAMDERLNLPPRQTDLAPPPAGGQQPPAAVPGEPAAGSSVVANSPQPAAGSPPQAGVANPPMATGAAFSSELTQQDLDDTREWMLATFAK